MSKGLEVRARCVQTSESCSVCLEGKRRRQRVNGGGPQKSDSGGPP